MPVVDLPAALGVDLSHCTYAADQAAKDSSLHITLSQGELFSPIYINNLASEVEEILSTEGGGATTISELALRFGLAADLLASFIKPKLSSRDVKAKLDGGVIYTDAFITRLKAQVRGALRGATTPLPLSTLTKALTTNSSGALVTSLLPNIIEDLSNTDEKSTSSSLDSSLHQQQPLQGKLSAGTWIPHCFVQLQQEGIKAAYAKNGYLTYDAVAKQGRGGQQQQSPKQFLLQTFPDGIALSECFVSPMMVQHVESAIEEMIVTSLQNDGNKNNDDEEDRRGWCDVLSMVPADMSSFDAASILEKALKSDVLSRKKGEVSVLASTVVMMYSLVEEIKSMVVEQAGKDAFEDGQKKKKKIKGEEKVVVGGGGVSSVQSSKKQQHQGNDDDDDDDDNWSMMKNNKKGGKKGKKPAAAAAGGGRKGAKGATTVPTSSSTAPGITTVPGIQAFIIHKYPDYEGSGTDGELPTALATQIRPAAAAEYERASQAIFTANADTRKKLRDAASRELEESHKKLQIYAHGIDLFSDDEGTVVVLSRHLLRTVGSHCCDAVLHCVAADFDNVEVSTAEQKAALIKQLPADQKAAIQSMMTALNGSGSEMVGVFIAELEKAAETEAGVWLKKLDKKAEKQLVFAHWKVLEEKLADEEHDGAAALAVLVPMLVGKMHGRAVSLPGRALSAVVEKLKGDLPADQHAMLVKFHGAVVELLKGGEGGGDDGGLIEMLGEVKGTKWGNSNGA